MIYISTDSKAFSIKHGIPLESDYCRKCGRSVTIDIPVISNDFVGFESASHEPCGQAYVISLLKPSVPLE